MRFADLRHMCALRARPQITKFWSLFGHRFGQFTSALGEEIDV
jgi:hypothetical protein